MPLSNDKRGSHIWRPLNDPLVPTSGAHEPEKLEIIDWTRYVEDSIDDLTGNPGKPFVIGIFGDSRAAGSNSSVGTGGLSTAVDSTFVWNPLTSAWRNASLINTGAGENPYYTDSNNIARSIAAQFRKKLNRPVYVVLYGVAGSTIFSWLDASAAHGLGPGGGGNFAEFKTRATAAFASSALADELVTTFDMLVVSLGANNGAATRTDFMGFMQNIIDQCRQTGIMPGTSPEVPVVWMQMQQAMINTSLHNNSILEMNDKTPSFGVASSVGATNVGDNVHEDSAGMEVFGVTTYKAWKSIDKTAPINPEIQNVIVYPGGATGGTASNPWIPPSGHPRTRYVIRTAAVNVFMSLDPLLWPGGAEIEASNQSSGGGTLFVIPPTGVEITRPETPGFTVTGVADGSASIPVRPGESVRVNKITDTLWEMASYSAAKPHFINCNASGTSSVTYTTSTVINGFRSVTNAGISLNAATGVFTIMKPGLYLVTANLWMLNTTDGFVRCEYSNNGGTNWDLLFPIANGGSSEAYARTGAGSSIFGTTVIGSLIRFLTASGSVLLGENDRFTTASIVQVG